MTDVMPGELLVFDGLEECPYFADRMARLPLRCPTERLQPHELDERLAAGDRRCGLCLYRAKCPTCSACEAIRLDVDRFQPNETQRRIERRGQRLLEIRIQLPQVDPRRVALFNLHRERRGLAVRGQPIGAREYVGFLCDTCCDTIELAYYLNERLVAVAVCDRGATALSAVYCYYDLDVAQFSPGVFSILTQVRLCREWRMRYLYLGYFIAESPHMNYKATYAPHERRIGGHWRRFDRAERPSPVPPRAAPHRTPRAR